MWWAIGATAASLALIWLVLGLSRANKVVDGAFEMLDEVESRKKSAEGVSGSEDGASPTHSRSA